MGTSIYINCGTPVTPKKDFSIFTEGTVIIKDWNLDYYFFTILGEYFLRINNLKVELLYPGLIYLNYKDMHYNDFQSIMEQWKTILTRLLNARKIDSAECSIILPKSFYIWFKYEFSIRANETLLEEPINIPFNYLYQELIENVLLKKLIILNNNQIHKCKLSSIKFDVDIFLQNSCFSKKIKEIFGLYPNVGYFSNERILYCQEELIGVKKDKWGFANKNANTVIPFVYNDICEFSEGLAWVKLNEKWGCVDKNNKTVIPFVYESGGLFSEGVSNAKLNGKWGYINQLGITTVPFVYEYAMPFLNGFAKAYMRGKCGLIDKYNKIVIPFDFEDVSSYSEGLAGVKLQTKWGYIDAKFNKVIPCIYKHISEFKKGIACVYKELFKREYINGTGASVFSLYGSIIDDVIHIGYSRFIQNEKYGIINSKGEIIIPCIYDDLKNSTMELFCARKGHKWGLVDFMKGIEALPCEYEDIRGISEGIIFVKQRNLWHAISINSDKIFSISCDDIKSYAEGFARIKRNGKWGFIDKAGNEIIECKYQKAYDFHNGYARITLDKNSKGIINQSGEEYYFINDVYNIGKELLFIRAQESKANFTNMFGVLATVAHEVTKKNKEGFLNKELLSLL